MGAASDPRYPLDYPVVIKTPKGSTVSAISLNMSRTGLGLRIPESAGLRMGDTVRVFLHVPGQPLANFTDKNERSQPYELSATVIWRGRTRCGLQITGMSEERTVSMYESLLDGYRMLQDLSITV